MCQKCGAKGGSKGDAVLQAHHIVPRSKGGADTTENLITLCNACHESEHGHEIPVQDSTYYRRSVEGRRSKAVNARNQNSPDHIGSVAPPFHDQLYLHPGVPNRKNANRPRVNTNSGVTIESATNTDQETVVTEQMEWPYPFQQYSDEDPFSNKHEVGLLPDVTVIEHRVEKALELDPEWVGTNRSTRNSTMTWPRTSGSTSRVSMAMFLSSASSLTLNCSGWRE